MSQHQYGSSATVYNITGREKTSTKADHFLHSKEDFQYAQEKCAHPEIIMNDSVSLYKVTGTEAVFVDCGSEDVFNPNKHTFAYDAQFKNATKLITMPLYSFHKVAATITMPEIPVLILAHHGRCGSTLIAKVFAAVPEAFVVCDLKCFSDIAELSRIGNTEEGFLKQLLNSTVLHVMKHASLRNSKICFMKHLSYSIYYTDLTFETVPSIKHVYMYRQPTSFVESQEKMRGVNGMPLTSEFVCKMSGFGHHKLMTSRQFYSVEEVGRFQPYTRLALRWMNSVGAFNCLLERGFDIKSLKYEDLLERPKELVTSLFNYADIPLSLIPDLQEVFSNDSQAGSWVSTRDKSKEELQKYVTPMTDGLKKELDDLCVEFDVPKFWDNIALQNPL